MMHCIGTDNRLNYTIEIHSSLINLISTSVLIYYLFDTGLQCIVHHNIKKGTNHFFKYKAESSACNTRKGETTNHVLLEIITVMDQR